ncbi:uncharacterized protein N7498_006798 [Penicillium cinerascens]|uniref:Uncharacterized protein n=1 Tax=Penicillium cinerascens TaxID=70096 RepID=A0A9W9MIY3_9EURO|nr:uncharacterized protein N7498_006798 [Penicillium cinerascens]KAJ5202135.1 hypothetical protein N7498_006798 [Penicillium cinerascens]
MICPSSGISLHESTNARQWRSPRILRFCDSVIAHEPVTIRADDPDHFRCPDAIVLCFDCFSELDYLGSIAMFWRHDFEQSESISVAIRSNAMSGPGNVATVSASAWYVWDILHLLRSKKLQSTQVRARSENGPIALARHVEHPRLNALGSDRCAKDVKTRA